MYVESFHNVLKSAYMERKANRQVDTLLNILLGVVRDNVFDCLIKLQKKIHRARNNTASHAVRHENIDTAHESMSLSDVVGQSVAPSCDQSAVRHENTDTARESRSLSDVVGQSVAPSCDHYQ